MAALIPKTYAQLTAATDVADGDLLASYRSTGPLKKLRADALADYVVSGPSAFDPGLTGSVDSSVQTALRQNVVLLSRFGLVLGGSSAADANVPKFQSAIDAAVGERKALLNDLDDVVWLSGNIALPAGETTTIDFLGMGWTQSKIIFTGTGVTKGIAYEGSGGDDYAYVGAISNMSIQCASGAKRGITIYSANHPRLQRVQVRGAAGCGVKMTNVLMGVMDHCLIVGCGSSTEMAVEIDGVSTTFNWLNSRISGTGANTLLGGLGLDGVQVANLSGGNIESNGTNLKIASKSASERGCGDINIIGMGFENPGNGNPYIDIGAGWTGDPGLGAVGVKIESVLASPSGGTTQIPYGLRAQNTINVAIGGNVSLTPDGTPTSYYEFAGANNFGWQIAPNRNNFMSSPTYPYVRANGAKVVGATPYIRSTDGLTSVIPLDRTIGGVTASASPSPDQGGACGLLTVLNATPTTMTNLTDVPRGGVVTLIAYDGNSTLKHLNGGSGQFLLAGGADLLMVSGRAYQFIASTYSSPLTLTQIGA